MNTSSLLLLLPNPKPPPEMIGAPVFDTPTTLLPKNSLLLLLSKPTHRPSTLKVRLLVKAHSTPPPSTQPTSLLLLRPKKPPPPLLTDAPANAAAGLT